MDRVDIIRRSLRCFAFGLLSLLPAIGLSFAILAIGDWVHVARRNDTNWNPADRYLAWGLASAVAGLLLTLLYAAILAIELWLPSWP